MGREGEDTGTEAFIIRRHMGRGRVTVKVWSWQGDHPPVQVQLSTEHEGGGPGRQGRRHPEGTGLPWSGNFTAPSSELLSDVTSVTH